MNKRVWMSMVFKTGEHFDIWHVNHLLTGVICAGITAYLNLTIFIGFAITCLGLAAWEYYEMRKGLDETKFNKFMDIITTLVGFLIFYFIDLYLPAPVFHALFWLCFVIWLALNIWGYWAYNELKIH